MKLIFFTKSFPLDKESSRIGTGVIAGSGSPRLAAAGG